MGTGLRQCVERRVVGGRGLSAAIVAAISAATAGGAPAAAWAQDPPAAPSVPAAPDLPGADEDVAEDRVGRLEEKIQELQEKLRQSEEQQRTSSASRLSIHGYADLGYFMPNGNRGVGFVQDTGNVQFPNLSGYSWTFLGDILATAVNSRGEAASLGMPPGVSRYDSINSDGAASFIANELNMRVGYALTDRAFLRTSVNFAPRSGRDFALGDTTDVDLAELEYVATQDGNTSFFFGKTMPVFGIEYKERKSDQRFGITPSLIQRYTSGPQLGAKFRSKLLNDWLILAGSITNNSSGTEQFHFQSEIDRNSAKTFNGRVAVSVPVGSLLGYNATDRLEIGGSGQWGTQDWAGDNVSKTVWPWNWFDSTGKIWFLGLDLQYLNANFAIKAQFIRGHAPGTADGTAFQLDLHNSGYVEVNWMILPKVGVLGRFEQRDAFVAQRGNPTGDGLRAYVTKSRRATGGVRVVFNPHMALKVEYLKNIEYGGVNEFLNDIFTSSLVLSY